MGAAEPVPIRLHAVLHGCLGLVGGRVWHPVWRGGGVVFGEEEGAGC